MQLVIADSIENTYEFLKEGWYGKHLHLDEYKAKKELLKNMNDNHVESIFKVENYLKFADGKIVYIHLISDGKGCCLNRE